MKKLILFLCLFVILKCHAQDTIHVTETDTLNMTMAQYVDSAFGSLDTTRMSTKYLIDRVGMAFRPNAHNGITDSTDTIKSNWDFYRIYSSIYAAQVSSHPNFTNPLVFAHHADSIYHTADTVVPIMLFYGRYNSIDTTKLGGNPISDPLFMNPYSVRIYENPLTPPYKHNIC